MATGRILKKQISLSEAVNQLSLKAVLLFTWAIAHADDFGRLHGSPRRVKGEVLPMRDDFSLDDVAACLREAHNAGLIIWYEVDGERYIQFPTWEVHQSGLHKRTASKIPPPPPDAQQISIPEIPGNSRNDQDSPGDSENVPGNSEPHVCARNRTEQELEQELEPEQEQETESLSSRTKRGKGEGYTPEFEAFWSLYPRRLGKKPAFAKWKAQLHKGVSGDDLLIAAKHYAIVCQGREERFILQPETFLGPQDRFQDYLDPPSQAQPSPRPSRAFAGLQAEYEREMRKEDSS